MTSHERHPIPSKKEERFAAVLHKAALDGWTIRRNAVGGFRIHWNEQRPTPEDQAVLEPRINDITQDIVERQADCDVDPIWWPTICRFHGGSLDGTEQVRPDGCKELWMGKGNEHYVAVRVASWSDRPRRQDMRLSQE